MGKELLLQIDLQFPHSDMMKSTLNTIFIFKICSQTAKPHRHDLHELYIIGRQVFQCPLGIYQWCIFKLMEQHKQTEYLK